MQVVTCAPMIFPSIASKECRYATLSLPLKIAIIRMNDQASSHSNDTRLNSFIVMAIVAVARTGFALFFALPSISIPLTLQANDVTSTSSDRVAKLAKAIEAGELRLEEDEKWGLLPSLLKALSIPEESQCLVFSKTSFSRSKLAWNDHGLSISMTTATLAGFKKVGLSKSGLPALKWERPFTLWMRKDLKNRSFALIADNALFAMTISERKPFLAS